MILDEQRRKSQATGLTLDEDDVKEYNNLLVVPASV